MKRKATKLKVCSIKTPAFMHKIAKKKPTTTTRARSRVLLLLLPRGQRNVIEQKK